MACLSHNVRYSFARRLVATTAFTPTSRRVGSVSRRASFDSVSFARAQTHYVQSASPTQLYSTTPDITSNEDTTVATTTTNNDNLLQLAAEEIDPYSDQAKDDLANFYKQNGIDDDDDFDVDTTHKLLLRLTEQVLAWNQRLNLVSRKDCNAAVVYHRHILPSIALLPLILEEQSTMMNNNDSDDASKKNKPLNIIDVGTGGGFPGLPLALLLPNVQFTLVDSIQKKLTAVSEMAAELDMTNVRVHWGRVEEMYSDEKGRREHWGRYDVVLGRSVTALPRFCGWVSDLMKNGGAGDLLKQRSESGGDEEGDGSGEGRLIYIIGGELDDLVESRIVQDIHVDTLLQRAKGTSDKRALIFNAGDVEEIATQSGEKDKIVRSAPPKKAKSVENQNNNNPRAGGGGGRKMAKGAWSKKQNDVKKQRGYDDFQRFES